MAAPAPASGSMDIHTAARTGNVPALLDALRVRPEFMVKAVDKLQRTPLHMAAWQNQLEAVKVLLSFKAPVDAAALDNVTPLQFAAQQGHLAVVEELVKAGADVNARNSKTHKTPLMCAAGAGHAKVVQVLLWHGAKPSMKTKSHQTALDMAKDDAVRALLQKTQTHLLKPGDRGVKRPVSGDGEPATSASSESAAVASAAAAEPTVAAAPAPAPAVQPAGSTGTTTVTAGAALTIEATSAATEAADNAEPTEPPAKQARTGGE